MVSASNSCHVAKKYLSLVLKKRLKGKLGYESRPNTLLCCLTLASVILLFLFFADEDLIWHRYMFIIKYFLMC